MHHKNYLQVLTDTIDSLPDHPVKNITYGAHVVSVESRKTGMATWAWHKHPVPMEALPDPGKHYSGKQLARLVTDASPLKASLGMAALGSLLPDIPSQHLTDLNAGDLILELGKNKKVAVIGHFPFVEKMKGKFDELMVFEKVPQAGDLEENRIPEKLPTADIVAITATTLSNKSLGNILDNCSDAAVKLLVGPSTPLCSAMFELGFDYIAGSLVEDVDIFRRGIIDGCAFKQIKGIKHVILKSG